MNGILPHTFFNCVLVSLPGAGQIINPSILFCFCSFINSISSSTSSISSVLHIIKCISFALAESFSPLISASQFLSPEFGIITATFFSGVFWSNILVIKNIAITQSNISAIRKAILFFFIFNLPFYILFF